MKAVETSAVTKLRFSITEKARKESSGEGCLHFFWGGVQDLARSLLKVLVWLQNVLQIAMEVTEGTSGHAHTSPP